MEHWPSHRTSSSLYLSRVLRCSVYDHDLLSCFSESPLREARGSETFWVASDRVGSWRRYLRSWWTHAGCEASHAHHDALPVVKLKEISIRPVVRITTHASGKGNDLSMVLPRVCVGLEDVDDDFAVALWLQTKKQSKNQARKINGRRVSEKSSRLVSTTTHKWVKSQISTIMNVVNVVTEQDAELDMVQVRRLVSEHLAVVLHWSGGQACVNVHHAELHQASNKTERDCNLPLCVRPGGYEQPCSARLQLR